MKQSTLCFCLHNNQLLLAMKKRGFGTGKWNGYGGKVQTGETPKQAAIRELYEESMLTATENALQQKALIHFYFDQELIFECHVFLLHQWDGTPSETEEMKPQWFAMDNLPYGDMWLADSKWIPLVIAGKEIEGIVRFTKNGGELVNFEYRERSFES